MNRQRLLIVGIVLVTLVGCLSLVYRLTYRVPASMVGEWETSEAIPAHSPIKLRLVISSDGSAESRCEGAGTLLHLNQLELRKWGRSLSWTNVSEVDGVRETLGTSHFRIDFHDDHFTIRDTETEGAPSVTFHRLR